METTKQPKPGKEKRQVMLYDNGGKPLVVGLKPSRNSICYCGSKKKYKHCHWIEENKQVITFTKTK